MQEDEERRALDKRKYLALSRRCKEIEQVCESVCVGACVCVSLHVGAYAVCRLFCTHFLNMCLVKFQNG